MRQKFITILTLVLLQSCDRIHKYEYVIVNQSNHRLTISFTPNDHSESRTFTLPNNSNRLFFTVESHGAEGKYPSDSEKNFNDDFKNINLISIDSAKEVISLKEKKNWEFSYNEEDGQYTLTIDSNWVEKR